MLKWEQIGTEHAESVFRLPVFGGWLVKIVQESSIVRPEAMIQENFGYQWTSSVTFVPDPEHRWNLEGGYGKLSVGIDKDFTKDLTG